MSDKIHFKESVLKKIDELNQKLSTIEQGIYVLMMQIDEWNDENEKQVINNQKIVCKFPFETVYLN